MSDGVWNPPETDTGIEDDGLEVVGFFSEPSTLAFIAFPLAVLTVLGTQVFRGLTYTLAFAPSDLGGADQASQSSTGYVVAAAFLTAAFSLIPLGLGAQGLRRLIPEDPTWLAGLLRAAIALSTLSLGLRLIAAVIVAARIHGGSGPLSLIGFLA